MVVQSVAIIGAGISGLVTANTMLKKGYTVTIFEKTASIGESWRRSIFYVGEVAQTLRKDYTFYDTDIPPLSGDWPDGEEMQQYLQAYALKTKIHQLISFHTTVQKIHFDTNGWKLSAWKQDNNRYMEQWFDAVIVCTGFASDSHSYAKTGISIRFRENHINTMLYDREYWQLYRNIAVAGSGSIGFVGLHGGLYFTLTATIAAHWMAAYLRGAIAPPAHLPLEKRLKRYTKKNKLSQLLRYLNLLLKDMGGKPRVSSNALLRLLGTSFKPEAYVLP